MSYRPSGPVKGPSSLELAQLPTAAWIGLGLESRCSQRTGSVEPYSSKQAQKKMVSDGYKRGTNRVRTSNLLNNNNMPDSHHCQAGGLCPATIAADSLSSIQTFHEIARSHAVRTREKRMARRMSIFDEQYRVVAIEGDRLFIRGVKSGEVLAIVNPEPETPLSPEDYPLGKLIALADPSATPASDLN